MLQSKDTRLHVRTSSEQVERLKRAADILEIPASDLVRKIIEEKLTKLSRQHPELAKKAA